MLTGYRGFTLIEVLVAVVIFFMAMAAVSSAFGNASQRLFKLRSLGNKVRSISQALANGDFEEETKDAEVKISYEDEGEIKSFTYDAEVKFLRFPRCPQCPELASKISIRSEAEER